MPLNSEPLFIDGISCYRPRGECTLVEAVDFVNDCVVACRTQQVARLLVNGTALTGMPIPTLVDRFLAVEEWASAAAGLVVVALVVRPEYIHPQKFGIRVAHDLGLVADVHTSETDALAWLATHAMPSARRDATPQPPFR